MKGQINPNAKQFSKELRREMTDAEQKLWRRLRGEQLGAKFRRQHPYLDFILDFVSLENKLVVEVDGGQHADEVANDAQRTRALEQAGFTVLRFWNNEVLDEMDAVVMRIYQEITPSPPQPSP